MRTSTNRRAGIVAACTLAAFSTIVGSAAAAPGEISSADITIDHPAGSINVQIPGTGTDPCPGTPLPDPAIDVEFDSPTSGEVEVVSLSAQTRFQTPTTPARWYEVEFQLDQSGFLPPNTGTYTPGANPPDYNVNDVHVALSADAYLVDVANNCARVNNANFECLDITVQMKLYGEYNGTVPPTPGAGDTVSLTGHSITNDTTDANYDPLAAIDHIFVAGACADPFFSALNGKDVTVNSLEFIFD